MVIVSPVLRVTIAFFQLGLEETLGPKRLVFPRILIVFTLTTVTSNASSTASLIWCLLALGATSKVYRPPSCISVLFSVMIGRLSMSRGCIGPIHPRPPRETARA